MRILIFNSRDKDNPNAGGAEIFTHEVAKRWVEAKNDVTLISSKFEDCAEEENVEGVSVRRVASFPWVFRKARRYYEKHLKGKFDILIDEYTLRPFFVPKFAEEPTVFLVHELAREKWFYETPFPLSFVGYHFLEPRWLEAYVDVPTITVSESTREDLTQIGYREVHVVPEGIGFRPVEKIPVKELQPTVLFVGLLKKANLADHALEAFRMVKEEWPTAKLWVVGRGAQLEKLKELARSLNVIFFGYVSERKKLELMSRAHLIIVPGVREGWGLVVTEANASGTPAIGYRIPGLRDSIRHGITGLLTNADPYSLAGAVIRFFHDEGLRQELTRNALEWSRRFSWDTTAEVFMDILETIIGGRSIAQ